MANEHLGEDHELLAVIVWLRVVGSCRVASISGKVHTSSESRDGAERAREIVVDYLPGNLLRRPVEKLLHIRASFVATLHDTGLFLEEVPLREILDPTNTGYSILYSRTRVVKSFRDPLVLSRFW